MSTYTQFTSRATYITARAEWRKDYARLSDRIRGLRESIKEKSRSGPDWAPANDMMQKASLRIAAQDMMAVREEMKELARQQVADERAQTTEVA